MEREKERRAIDRIDDFPREIVSGTMAAFAARNAAGIACG